MRIGSVAGSVTGSSAEPLARPARLERREEAAIGSLSSKRPSSHSIIAATDVTGLVIE